MRYLDRVRTKNDPLAQTMGWLAPVIVVLSLILCIAGYYLFRRFYHDDAFISLRYAYNLLHGHGLVWNPGEYVEGYSNFLWVMLVSLLGVMGIDLVVATKVLGVTCFLGCGACVWRFCRSETENREVAAPVALLLVLSALPMIVWSIGGLEPVLFALLLLIAGWYTLKAAGGERRAALFSGVLFALLAMTRPDGPLYLVGALVWLWFNFRGAIARIVLLFALVFGAFLVWRYFYYGDLLPNPYYVKGDVSPANLLRGLVYLRDYLLSLPYLLPLALVSAIWLRFRGEWKPRHSLLVTLIAVHLVYVTLVGGDHMPAFRFLVPIIPLCAVMMAEAAAFQFRFSTGGIRAVPLALITVLVVVQMIFPPEMVARAKKEDGAAFLGRIVGEYINVTFPKGSLIALNTAGSTPYFAPDHRFIDMLGLNDRTIAKRKDPPRVARWQDVPGHEKGDGEYVLNRQPDYIIAGGAVGYAITMGWFLSEYELAHDPEFERHYTPQIVLIPVQQYDDYQLYEESESGEMGFAFYKRNQP